MGLGFLFAVPELRLLARCRASTNALAELHHCRSRANERICLVASKVSKHTLPRIPGRSSLHAFLANAWHRLQSTQLVHRRGLCERSMRFRTRSECLFRQTRTIACIQITHRTKPGRLRFRQRGCAAPNNQPCDFATAALRGTRTAYKNQQ